eukprot:TRINITY_DN20743_c0_g1_i1.p1 TRINITY_DN20743_c0_g1~~TRINITY_DN20743_c0_g1_i1.p1  ORF type:complete len:976 (-),score=267.71 TRINITY_DN20743_c0_g1_i1:31-2715(-)
MGMNHGRKVYRKELPPGQRENKALTVLLYFWDTRQGTELSGWWLGNSIGGSEVYAFNKESSQLPPSSGWKLPWDSAETSTLRVESEAAQLEAQLEPLKGEVSLFQLEAKTFIEKAILARENLQPDSLKDIEVGLPKQLAGLSELGKKVGRMHLAMRKTGQDSVVKSLQQLSNGLRELQTHLQNEYSNLKLAVKKSEDEQKMQEQALEENQFVATFLPDLTCEVNNAEDETEKAVITAEMLDGAEDEALINDVVQQTEGLTQAALAAVAAAKQLLAEKKPLVDGLQVESVREKSQEELQRLVDCLDTAQKKLMPLKTIRQDWRRRLSAKKVIAEIEERVVSAEVEVDRAEAALESLAPDVLNSDTLEEAVSLVNVADKSISSCHRLLETKKASLKGSSLQKEVESLESRLEAFAERQANCQASVKNKSDELTTGGYVQEAVQKVDHMRACLAKLEEHVTKARVEDLKGDAVLASSKKSDALAASAQQASSTAQRFIQTKLLALKRFSSPAAAESSSQLQKHLQELELAVERLAGFRSEMAAFKSKALISEATEQIARAEEAAQELKDAAASWTDEGVVAELTTSKIREATEQRLKLEKNASTLIADARKLVASRLIEAKSKEGADAEVSTQLQSFQQRLVEAQAEVTKARKVFSTLEQQLALQRILADAGKNASEAETKVVEVETKVRQLTLESSDVAEAATPQSLKEAEASVQEVQISVKTLSRKFEASVRAMAASKTIEGITLRLKQLEERLLSAASELKQQSGRILVQGLTRDAEAKLQQCQEHLDSALELESQVKESSSLGQDAVQVGLLLSQLDKAVSVAVGAVSSAKTDISMKRLSVKRIPPPIGDAANEDLTKLIGNLDGMAEQLKTIRSAAADERKRLFQVSRSKET